MKVLTSEQMRRIDERAIRTMKVPGLALMESAGLRAFDVLRSGWPGLQPGGAVIVCGGGNNGGDGLVLARHLLAAGLEPRVLLAARAAGLRGDARENLRAARGVGVTIEEVATPAAWRKAAATLTRHEVIVDALLGTGLRGAVRGFAARVIADINTAGAAGAGILAIDIPSGLSGASAAIAGPAVRATRTVTFCRPKLPHVLPPACDLAGELHVVAIGIPDAAVDAERGPAVHFVESGWLAGRLRPRRPSTHKGDCGDLLLVAGSRDRSGAAALAARAALRGGAGLVTVATASSAQAVLAPQAAEMMTAPLAETRSGTVSDVAFDRARELADGRDVLAVGPGLGTDASTRTFIRRLLAGTSVSQPAVLDADGLNAFAGRLADLPRRRVLVLTPHPGEMARLAETTIAAVLADRLGSARALATGRGVWVVLKGHRTIVAGPDGEAHVNPTGNPAMATAGAGDALTGFLAALLGQGYEPRDACLLAVWLHGRAGDLAASRLGASLTAGDLIDAWPEAVKDLSKDIGCRVIASGAERRSAESSSRPKARVRDRTRSRGRR